MHRTTTIVALAACGLFTTVANAQVTFVFEDSGQALGSSPSVSVALGDLDGDGDLDAMVANLGSPNTVWTNDGTGTFTDSGQSLGNSPSFSVALGDLDGDGDLDAMVANGLGEPNTVWTNDGTGIFTKSEQELAGFGNRSVALGDLDGDGDLDAMVVNDDIFGVPNTVWTNNGSGTFTNSGQALGNSPSFSVALGDLDGDGDLDAMVANGGMFGVPNTVWTNDGAGIFTNSEQELGSSNSRSVALGDLDGDGDLDAMVANNGSPSTVWTNDGTGTFTDSGQALGKSSSLSVALGDLDGDGDGDLDAIVLNYDGQLDTVWANDGTGTFTNSGQALGSSFSTSVALGDLDGDGDLDAMVARESGQPNTVWTNESDRDRDGIADDLDGCPDDPDKTESGYCGCGLPDTLGIGGCDRNGDGVYDAEDVRLAMANFGITEGTPGDMDGDDDVDAADFVAVRDQVGLEALGCVVADINGDGEVDGADFAYVLGYWGVCAAP